MESWIPEPSTRLPLTLGTFTSSILPPIVCLYATALLVLLPRTLWIRLALWPITLYLAFRASITVDMVKGLPLDPDDFAYMNQVLVLAMANVGMLSSIWSLQTTPYRRTDQSGGLLLDALDLTANMRGIGWSWSTGLKLPKETRNMSSQSSFLFSTFRSLFIQLLFADSFLLAVQSFEGIFAPVGATIFDSSLPPIPRYIRSSCITFLTGMGIYHIISIYYALATIIALTILPRGPKNNTMQWPPLFQSPWCTTSIAEFWSQRWHQLFRYVFINFGGVPFYLVFGRIGAVFGTFFASGVFHAIGLWGMGRGTDFVRITGFFLMMAVGITLEFAFKYVMGRRVGGILGWIWSALWIIGWGNMLVEAWLSRGMAGTILLPDRWRPSLKLLAFAKANLM
ncbi:hypothetical protein D9613_007731 [Agrocybe pediades]|uniref:Wax synthase domain-containing protein n=1 Tax=Agrocybe pediades TaxID=84607 RepID=A0A8H4QN60_9AGAR|nr:hypothetical protein D9613_007731 [Agrocybe pediades]